MFVVCRITANSEPESRRCTAAERDQTPSGENGADCCEWVDLWTPECVCLRVGPPVWPTACLYSRLSVCVLFALRRSALQCRPWTCKKKDGSPLMYFTHWGMWRHTNGCIKQVCDLQTKGADVCCCWSGINQLRPFSDFSTVIPTSLFLLHLYFSTQWLLSQGTL